MKSLICVSDLPYAQPTLLFGGLLSKLSDADITVMSVVDDPNQKLAKETMLRSAQKQSGLTTAVAHVRVGKPVTEIINESHEGDYDLLVVGASIVDGLLDHLLRSVTRKVAEKADTSVLVVKENPAQIRRILVCTGGSAASRPVISMAANLAQAAQAKVKILHVADPIPKMYSGLGTMEETATGLLSSGTPLAEHLAWSEDQFAAVNVPVKILLRHGIPADKIIEEAINGNYDLLIIGTHSQTSLLRGLLMGDMTSTIVERSPCSVMIIRPNE